MIGNITFEDCTNTFKYYPELKTSWYKMNDMTLTYFGSLTTLYKKYDRPDTYQEFFDKYISDPIVDNDFFSHGRTEEQLLDQAKRFREIDGSRYPIEVYYKYIIHKVVIQTVDGFKKEREFDKLASSFGFKSIEPFGKADTTYGIDRFLYKDGKIVACAQIKPATFFRGNYNKTLIEDRKKAIIAERKATDIYKCPVYYYIYDTEADTFVKRNGVYSTELKDLIDERGCLR